MYAHRSRSRFLLHEPDDASGDATGALGLALRPDGPTRPGSAVVVQDALAERSRQRGARIADLLITAAAEAARLVVLHYDHDFELTAEITGQPTDWIVPAGTVS